MKNLITITLILTSALFCKGQSLNLVPIDSANFEIVADTLFDRYSAMQDSIKFNPELYKICPCAIDSVKGLISYRSSSVFRKYNRCLFLFKTDSDYYIRVGRVPDVKDKSLKYSYELSPIRKISNETAEKYIALTKKEIDKAEVPRFDNVLIVNDGASHTFGDLGRGLYATTPIYVYDSSDSVKELIEFSEKLIKDNGGGK